MKLTLACVCAIILLVACDNREPLPGLNAPTPVPNPVPSPTPTPVPTPSPIPPPAPAGPYILSGVVRDAANVPVAGAKVVLLDNDEGQELSASVTTDGNGHYSISNVWPSSYGYGPLVSASKSGYFAGLKWARVSQDTELDFALEPLTYISLGDVVRGSIGNAACAGLGYGGSPGGAPCQRFALTAPSSGTLEVMVSASLFNFDSNVIKPDGTIAVERSSSSSPVRMTLAVKGGMTYQIRVAGGWSPAREFELTTVLR